MTAPKPLPDDIAAMSLEEVRRELQALARMNLARLSAKAIDERSERHELLCRRMSAIIRGEK